MVKGVRYHGINVNLRVYLWYMKNIQNEGLVDRIIRIVLAGVLLLGGYVWLVGAWQTVAYVVGVISLITGLTGFCGIYKLFGMHTNNKEDAGKV
jgi:hypothetical protein